jgi:hypothetical protein
MIKMPNVKLFACIPRRIDVSRQFFHDHWRHPHGTMGLSIKSIRRYVQSHQIDCAFLGQSQTRFEGCAEVGFGSVEDAIAFANDPIYREHVVPDESLFIDMPSLRHVVCDEEVIQAEESSGGVADWRHDNRPVSIKLIQFVEEDGPDRWDRADDALLGGRLLAHRHVRSRPSPQAHPDAAFFLGVRELWWPSLSDFENGIAQASDSWSEMISRPQKSTTMLVQAERYI